MPGDLTLDEIVATWIMYLRDRRVRVGTQDVMLVGPGARAASQNPGAMRALMIEGLVYEAPREHPAAWLPTRDRVEGDAKRPLNDLEWEEVVARLKGAILLMHQEGMIE
jgi:hypothetical protein